MYNKPLSSSACVRHPRRQQCKCAIRLPDDEMLGACVTLYADNRNDFTAAWVKWIGDPNFDSRTPGSMTLLRPAPAKPIFA
jgi:hypothetical protein